MVEVRGESIFIEWGFYLKFFSFCITVQKRVGIYIWWVGTNKVNEKDINEILKIIFFSSTCVLLVASGFSVTTTTVAARTSFIDVSQRGESLHLGHLVSESQSLYWGDRLGLRIELGVGFVIERFDRQRARPWAEP